MRWAGAALGAALTLLAGLALAGDRPPPPPWAFVLNPPGAAPAPADDGAPHRLPGSAVALTLGQVRNAHDVPDWHPDDHPPMPDVVAHGRGDLLACGYCHLPNGLGRPENASLAGLPAAYIVQQLDDFRQGLRRSSQPDAVPTTLMIKMAAAASDAEVRTAAEYFAALKPRRWIRVVETPTVPQTRAQGYMLVPVAEGGREAIGRRIVEVPEDTARTELRDSGSGFIAYVPEGAVRRGEALVRTGGGRTTPCASCHGADLKGLGPVPPLAGRSPSYLFRQLWDFQGGERAGLWSPLMGPVVARLTADDMIDLAAYAAAQMP